MTTAENAARYLVRGLLEGKRGDLIIKVSENNAEVEVNDPTWSYPVMGVIK